MGAGHSSLEADVTSLGSKVETHLDDYNRFPSSLGENLKLKVDELIRANELATSVVSALNQEISLNATKLELTLNYEEIKTKLETMNVSVPVSVTSINPDASAAGSMQWSACYPQVVRERDFIKKDCESRGTGWTHDLGNSQQSIKTCYTKDNLRYRSGICYKHGANP